MMSHCRNILHCIYPFIHHGHVGYFHFLAITNNAATNISVHCGHTFSFLLGIPRSRIAESYGNSVFNILKNWNA